MEYEYVRNLGVVIPLANEEETVVELLTKVLAQLEPRDNLYLVVDLASKDKTWELVEKFSWRDSRVHPIWAPENTCVVDAYFRGYKEAYEKGNDWILEMDGGLSHDPAQIPEFREKLEEGYEYVGGSRYLPGGYHQSPWQRRFVSWAGSKLASFVLRCPMTDMTSGYEAFNGDTMFEVLDKGARSRANFFQTEIRFRMRRFDWCEIPIRYVNNEPKLGKSCISESLINLFRLFIESFKKETSRW